MTVNVSEFLRATAQRDPEGIALIEPRTDREITWAEFDDWADRVAQTLLGLGLVAGNRVGLVMANGLDHCVAWFGLLRGGMVAVPISPRSTPDEISRAVADSQVKLVVADADSITQVRAADTGSARIVVHRVAPEEGEIRFGSLVESAPEGTPIAPPDAEALAVILYTAGASGQPRGAMLSHRALIANIEQVGAVEPAVIEPDDVVLGLLPMSHIYGLNAVLGQSVRVGASVVLVNSFDPEALLTLVQELGVTNLPIAPPVVAAWASREGAREKLAGVRLIVSGASPLDPELAYEFEKTTGHRVEQGYGLTESAPVLTVTVGAPRSEPDVDGPRPSTVGRVVPGVELQLLDPLGNPATPGDPAQVWVKGDNLFSGYWPGGVDGPNEEGWWATGDMGFVDADGNLTLVDRLREMVKVSGFTVYPSEVEEVVTDVPGVSQVAVVGRPDERTGEAIVVFVVPEDPEHADSDALAAAIQAECDLKLARFKRPGEIQVLARLPHSPTGKVAKGRLRALARGEQLGLAP